MNDPRQELKPENYVELSFQDEGVGIPPSIMAYIFDPYFYTRQDGSVLVFFSCYSILNKYEGWITAVSEVDVGSTFTFYLPMAEQETVMVNTKSKSMNHRNARVLVMDDDDTIRLGLTALLNELGYKVTATSDGEEAIGAYQAGLTSDQPFDVVILDLTIPAGMGGAEVMQHLKKLDPDVKAIVSSGYATDPIMANYKKHGFQGILPKPFRPEDLSKVMEKVLH